MKKQFRLDGFLKYEDAWLLVLRISIAAFMITHGIPKLEKLMAGGDIQFADPIGLGPTASLALAVFSEFFCSILLAFGLFTRLSVIPLVITMVVAAFITHSEDPFKTKEMALMYLLIYGSILFRGGGKYALENVIFRK
ncbi:MAG: DoxX family membrane protein [Bacteroidetes bacterium]|nr:DoxX family membrane protein [Bacteroidota bacterium]